MNNSSTGFFVAVDLFLMVFLQLVAASCKLFKDFLWIS